MSSQQQSNVKGFLTGLGYYERLEKLENSPENLGPASEPKASPSDKEVKIANEVAGILRTPLPLKILPFDQSLTYWVSRLLSLANCDNNHRSVLQALQNKKILQPTTREIAFRETLRASVKRLDLDIVQEIYELRSDSVETFKNLAIAIAGALIDCKIKNESPGCAYFDTLANNKLDTLLENAPKWYKVEEDPQPVFVLPGST